MATEIIPPPDNGYWEEIVPGWVGPIPKIPNGYWEEITPPPPPAAAASHHVGLVWQANHG